MLAQIFSSGQASSTSASMRSLPVVNTPALPFSRVISSALLQTTSSGLAATSKWRSSRAMVSGKIARATSSRGFCGMGSPVGSQRKKISVTSTNSGSRMALDQAM